MTQIIHDTREQMPETKPGLLVIDDELEIAKSLQRQFRRKYLVHIATSADEALQIMREQSIQIVISDQRMPGITGVEFFAHIKHSHPDTIRILLTGYADIDAVIDAINDGSIFRYLKKPWDRVEIERVLSDAYEHHFLVSENNRLLNELHQSERRYRTLFENSPVAMMECDLSAAHLQISHLPIVTGETLNHYWGAHPHAAIECLTQIGILDHNLAMLEMLQTQSEEAAKVALSGLLQTALAGFFRALLSALNDGKQGWNQDETLHTAENRLIHVSVFASVMPGHEQTWDRTIVALTDISERKQAEAALQRALDRETELNNLRQGIIETVSHEFRTPLAVIQSSSETLSAYAERLNPDQRHRHAGRIKVSTQRMTALLDEILLFSRIDTDDIEINRIPTDLAALCTQLIADIEETQMVTPRISLTHDDECAQVLLDPIHVTSALKHLVENALRFSPANGLIEITVNCTKTHAVICVSDSGSGIPDAEQVYLFDAFITTSSKGTKQGIGLGLAIAKRLVELQGGSISAQSQEGKGTKISVSFPLKRRMR